VVCLTGTAFRDQKRGKKGEGSPESSEGENDRMAVKVMIPTPLRQFTGKQPSIECNAATVGEALGSLTGTFSELRKHLFTDEGKIRSFVNVYLNDEDIRFLNKENTPTKDGDTISIVPSIAGGSAACGMTAL
jgi:molybdopterin synthase sulfur carrier subunit